MFCNVRKLISISGLAITLIAVGLGNVSSRLSKQAPSIKLGKQNDGSFVVSTLQRVQNEPITIEHRCLDMAYKPGGGLLAILCQHSLILSTKDGVISSSNYLLPRAASHRGIAWSPDGLRLFASVSDGFVHEFQIIENRIRPVRTIQLKQGSDFSNPRPGGIAITKDGRRMYVALCDRNSVAEIDLTTNRRIRELQTQNLPCDVKLSSDEKSIIVTNWGGRTPLDEDKKGRTGASTIAVDARGAAVSGTVTIIDLSNGEPTNIDVGIHPTSIAVSGKFAYITNSASDSISEVDMVESVVSRTIPLKYGSMNLLGSMPCAITVRNSIAYVCNAGDNALCELDLITGKVRGFRPVGYFPVAVEISRTGKAIVLNSKGQGSVRRILRNKPGNAHDFMGTVSSVDISRNISEDTERVAAGNGWGKPKEALTPNLRVYTGAIKHVLYIIKENRSYDEILGDMPQGNGDPKLAVLGEEITPNHHAIARQFTLFDNAYVSGTNSADGHQWCTQAMANEYIERFYPSFRTYSFDGSCAMSLSNSGALWDAALKKGKTIRDYGEFCDFRLAKFSQSPHNWKDMWQDRAKGKNSITVKSGTRIPALKPYIDNKVLGWPLVQSDQHRADEFIRDYQSLSKANKVPNLMFLTLPCDHTEGLNPGWPTPQSMVADNDLALGRVIEAVTKSPEWKNTCIFVIEDDAQFGLDHIDGHRTVFFTVSPFTKRGYVDHELCNTVSIVRSIELMLGLQAMNRFDAVAIPLIDCFSDIANLSKYTSIPNKVPLDEFNRGIERMNSREKELVKTSMALDWSDMDAADGSVLNRIMWASIKGFNSPYPGRPSLQKQNMSADHD